EVQNGRRRPPAPVQLGRVDGQVARIHRAEVGLRRAVLQEVARHPVVLAARGEILDLLAPASSMQLRAALARGADEHDGETLIERHRDERRLAVPRYALDADAASVDARLRREEIEPTRSAPGPCAERAPVVGRTPRALVGEPDDPARESRAV